ncbi:MAG: polyprenyl synthetase family protein [Candidatus Diapherotrites archaeon]
MKESIEEYLKENTGKINKEIERFFPRKITGKWIKMAAGKPSFSYDTETLTRALSEPIWDFLDRGGKRWRPSLMLMVYEALSGKSAEKIMPFVLLPEFAHNGSIMVDDIEDDSELRRGKPCTHKIFGIDIAINAGNTLYFLPLILLYKNLMKLSYEKRTKIYDLYAIELLKLSFGQATDIYWHQGKKEGISEGQYLQMCAFKTGTLARLSAKLGAILADAGKEQTEKIGRFGESIGVVFQIQDDVLNLTGEEFQKGKGIGEDIHEGKRTLMVLYTLSKANEKERKRLVEILNSHPSDKKTIIEAIELMEKYKAIDYARKKAEELVQKSWAEIKGILPEGKAKERLREFAEFAIKRKV